MNRFAIDGVEITAPSEFTVTTEDISSEEAGRTLDGVMHKDIVKVVETMQCSWNLLSWEDTATILNLVRGKAEMEFTYPDPHFPNASTTRKCYVGSRKAPAYTLAEGKERWKGLSFNFIEVGEENDNSE